MNRDAIVVGVADLAVKKEEEKKFGRRVAIIQNLGNNEIGRD